MAGLNHYNLYYCIYIVSLILSLGQYILGDVRIDNNILQIYYTINESTETKDWVTVCFEAGNANAVANVACRQLGKVGAIRFGPASQK